jgi:radical SAM superfamily enzyme YgiQ (UPF0313 family)
MGRPSLPNMPQPKNILLVNPWIYDFTAFDFWMKPLGLLLVGSVLRQGMDCRLRLLDCLDRHHPGLQRRRGSRPDGRGPLPKVPVAKPQPLREIPRLFSRYGIPVELFRQELDKGPRPDAVLMTCVMTYWYPGVQLACRLIREKWAGVPILLGGLYATLVPEHARAHSGADIVIPGPGENRVLAAMSDLLGDGSVRLKSYDGIGDWPVPAFDLLGNRETLPLLTSRGCPSRCSFCATPVLHGRLEQRSPESVVSELEDHARRWTTRNIAFYDDALLANKESHIIPILEAAARRALPLSFHTPNGLGVREIDDRLARLFRAAGVRSVFLSQESLDDDLLGRACPKVSSADLGRALASLEAAGYPRAEVNVYLIAGLPDQDLRLVRESIRGVRRLGARPRLAFFSPVPGTADWKRAAAGSGLRGDADPLLHNKLASVYLRGDASRAAFDEVRKALTEALEPPCL